MESLDPISRWAHTVYWDAWGPLLSLAAVLWAIWIAGASSRDSRRRDAARVDAVLVLTVGLAEIFATRAMSDEGADIAETYRFDAFQNLRVFAETIKITDLPTAGAVDAFMRVATRIQIVQSAQNAKVQGQISNDRYRAECRMAAELMAEAIHDLLRERRKILGFNFWALFHRREAMRNAEAPSPKAPGEGDVGTV
ncbi:MAG: hypothetical protein EON87_12430 [Brevundimonas sp.]|nr:MAG: hypothetical protein EON87_12430 [Brevundimonas sp.]